MERDEWIAQRLRQAPGSSSRIADLGFRSLLTPLGGSAAERIRALLALDTGGAEDDLADGAYEHWRLKVGAPDANWGDATQATRVQMIDEVRLVRALLRDWERRVPGLADPVERTVGLDHAMFDARVCVD